MLGTELGKVPQQEIREMQFLFSWAYILEIVNKLRSKHIKVHEKRLVQ